MNKNKFRIYDHYEKRFLPHACWLNSLDFNEFMAFDRYFKCDKEKCAVQQFIGILDQNMKEIYEEDVVKFKTGTKEDIGVVQYMDNWCSYAVEVESGYDLFADISLDSLEVVGNMIEDFRYNEDGKLIKHERAN